MTDRGGAEADHPRAGPLRAPRREVRGAGHPCRTGHDPHRGAPLVGVGAALGYPRGDIDVFDEMRARRRNVEADVGHLDAADELATRVEDEPGLERGKRDGERGPHHGSAHGAREPVDARRDVDGDHRGVAGIGRGP